MFTVCHEYAGETRYYETKNVRRVGPHSLGAEGVWIDAPDDAIAENRRLEGGTVYIMNETGATVAKWRLPDVRVETTAGAQIGGIGNYDALAATGDGVYGVSNGVASQFAPKR